ncbi:RNA polymerase sigma factor [Glaciecola petra]|uniref:RNA polymerase sigma factor n=1 Tax=Glaciecola petra TaxID=3075602 RepID=A0ABU2ZQ05_9ALTE|nr:RNA polymerase sigma factor [Aestuariibacter sp. P117]MDT0594704.1 RNA polymerase sigma factor [Aestuariibacter sp. P117]
MLAFLQSFFDSNINPEEALAQYIYSKNKQAMSTIYNAYANDLYHFLLTLSDADDAKDIAQKTWLLLIEHPEKCNATGNLKSWLFKVARNALIDEFRKTNRLQSLSDSNSATLVEAASAETQNAALHSEQTNQQHFFGQDFDRALMSLSFNQREAFCLQQDGFSLNEIATITSCNQETVKTRIRYAKKNLKRSLEANDE